MKHTVHSTCPLFRSLWASNTDGTGIHHNQLRRVSNLPNQPSMQTLPTSTFATEKGRGIYYAKYYSGGGNGRLGEQLKMKVERERGNENWERK